MHYNFMLAALEQAQLQRGFCSPNPAVGAVAVVDNTIVARSTHQGAGTPHAEILLLEQLENVKGDITLYVTLEPCNHWGRTPPCVDAIIKRGIHRVVYAHIDPNPLVSRNNTTAILRSKGIDVIHYPMARIERFYQSYDFWMKHKRPWVTAKIAQSLDGKIAGTKYQPVKLTNQQCADFTHLHRRQTDIILTSAKTILCDNPLLTARDADTVLAKPLAIIDRRLELTADQKAVQNAKHCHIFHEDSYTPVAVIPNSTYHPVPALESGLDLEAIIDTLGTFGYHDVWVEAGGRLFTALHHAGLVQRSYIYIAPLVLGQDAIETFPVNNGLNMQSRISWKTLGNNLIGRFDWMDIECSQV